MARKKNVSRYDDDTTGEERRLMISVRKVIIDAFKNTLINKNLATYKKRAIYISHVGHERGAYIYGPDKTGSFKITINDIMSNMDEKDRELFDDINIEISEFKSMSLRICPASNNANMLQTNIHPSMTVTHTVGNKEKSYKMLYQRITKV